MEDVALMESPVMVTDMKKKLSDVLMAISWREFANTYFQRSSSWFYHKMDGIDGKMITGSVLVIILQGNIFVELRTNLYLCRRRLISCGEYGTTVKEEKRNGNLPCDGQRHQPSGHL